MVNGFPLDETVIISAVSLWCIKIPTEKYGKVRLLLDGTQILAERFTSIERAKKKLEAINEWARKQGGRPVEKKETKPKEKKIRKQKQKKHK